MKIAKREASTVQEGASALSLAPLGIDEWMCDARRVGAQVSLAWSRHIALPRWRAVASSDSDLIGALVLFCGDSLHPFEPQRTGFAKMCYGFRREVIVLGVRRSDRAVLELVPRAAGDEERRLCHAAANAPDFVLSAVLGVGRWRLSDSWRGFLVRWFSHGFGMAAVQHAHMCRVMLDRVDPRALPQPLDKIEAELNRREIGVMRRARRRLLEWLDPEVVRSVRRSNAILTPATYNLVATAAGEARERRVAALSTYPSVLPAFIAKDPPIPGNADVLAYYESGSEHEFRALARFIVGAVDRGEPLSPYLSRPFDTRPQVIQAVRDVPRLVLWRIGAWGLHALLRAVDAVPAGVRPTSPADWVAFRDIAVAVAALTEAFEDFSEEAGAQFW
ncbi:MAG TPA: hypothetical protein VD791_02550, partial [Burkholderiales bacterium]|nr:hypothetical protein [Burkholderiales bacterium]